MSGGCNLTPAPADDSKTVAIESLARMKLDAFGDEDLAT